MRNFGNRVQIDCCGEYLATVRFFAWHSLHNNRVFKKAAVSQKPWYSNRVTVGSSEALH
jgi:hypothetical protein